MCKNVSRIGLAEPDLTQKLQRSLTAAFLLLYLAAIRVLVPSELL
jgi:hypothetical protein